MQESSSYDKERISHINHLMENINDSSSQIYESLVDREFSVECDKLISILKDISSSVEDDI